MVFFSCHWHSSKFSIGHLLQLFLSGMVIMSSFLVENRLAGSRHWIWRWVSGRFLILLVGSCSYRQKLQWICEFMNILEDMRMRADSRMEGFYDLDRRIVLLIIFNILGVPSFVFVLVMLWRSSSIACCHRICYPWCFHRLVLASVLTFFQCMPSFATWLRLRYAYRNTSQCIRGYPQWRLCWDASNSSDGDGLIMDDLIWTLVYYFPLTLLVLIPILIRQVICFECQPFTGGRFLPRSLSRTRPTTCFCCVCTLNLPTFRSSLWLALIFYGEPWTSIKSLVLSSSYFNFQTI